MLPEMIYLFNVRRREVQEAVFDLFMKQELYNISYDSLLQETLRVLYEDAPPCEDALDWNRITKINDGDYQGTLIFIIPLQDYQPNYYQYYGTWVNYGSCSYCDTMLSIIDGVEVLKNHNNFTIDSTPMKDAMTVILHMLQNMRQLFHNF